MLEKNWRLCTQLAASMCKICFRVALIFIVPAHFPNQISKGRQLNSYMHGWGCGLANAKKIYHWCKTGLLHTFCLLVSCLVPLWPPVACKLYLSGRQSHANCTWVAASRMQIVPGGQSHANFGRFYSCLMWLAATRVQFACDWQPLRCNLYATGRQSHANFACTCGQLHA